MGVCICNPGYNGASCTRKALVNTNQRVVGGYFQSALYKTSWPFNFYSIDWSKLTHVFYFSAKIINPTSDYPVFDMTSDDAPIAYQVCVDIFFC